MEEDSPQSLSDQNDKRLYWDWWSENPVEIVLVVLLIVLFVMVPWQGCGITEQEPDQRMTADEVDVVP